MRKLVLLIVCFVLIPLCNRAQSKVRIDSLTKVITTSKYDTARCDAYIAMSLEYRLIGNPDSALQMAENGLDLARKIGYKKGEGRSLYYVGIVYFIKGDLVSSLSYYSAARDSLKAINDLKNYSSVLTAMGGVLSMIGDQEGAIDMHLESMRIKREIGDSVAMASAMNNIGNVYHAIGQYDTALKYFRAAAEIHARSDEYYKVADDYFNIGNTYHVFHQDSLAMWYLRRSIAIADSLEYVEVLAYSYSQIASMFFETEQYDSAGVYYNRALTLGVESDDQRIVGMEYLNLGNLYAAQGKPAEAEASLRKALAICSEIGDVPNLSEIYKSLGQFYEKQHRYDSALANYKTYIRFRDSLTDVDMQTEIARKQMKSDFDAQEKIRQAEQDKRDAVTAADIQERNLLIVGGAVVLVLVLVFAWFMFNRAKVTRRQNVLIQQQKAEVEHQRDQVELQKAEIEEKNKSITDSITYARRIQQAILPDAKLVSQLLPQSFVFYKPKDIVSGDFYWVAETPEHIFYATVDCTGHGVPGGFMSVLGASLLNEIVNERGVASPAEILNLMRDKIVSALHQTGESGENKDGMDMSICRLNRSRGELCFAAANNGLWLVRNGELTEYKADKQPVGIGASVPKPFTAQTVVLQKDDMVYTFTDGFADQFGGGRGKKYKYSQLKSFLLSCADDLPEVQLQKMSAEFESWRGDAEQIDDVLVIGIKI